jgi:hypothetical protein
MTMTVPLRGQGRGRQPGPLSHAHRKLLPYIYVPEPLVQAATTWGKGPKDVGGKIRPEPYEFSFGSETLTISPSDRPGARVPTTLPKRGPGGYRRRWVPVAAEQGLLGATLFIALVFCVAVSVLPSPLVLPASGLCIVLAGIALAAYEQVVRRLGIRSTSRLDDIAGVLCLFGFAALIICDRTAALQNLAVLTEP